MNVFEKYIDNVKQNKELTEIINDLCQIHFIHSAPYIESLWGHKFIKFLRWEIDIDNCPPVSAILRKPAHRGGAANAFGADFA